MFSATTAWSAHSFALNQLVPVGFTVDERYPFVTAEALCFRSQSSDAIIDRYSQNLPQRSARTTHTRMNYTHIRCPNNRHAMHDSGILWPVLHHLNRLILVFRSIWTAVHTNMLQLPDQMNTSCPARAAVEASDDVLKVRDLGHGSPARGNHNHCPVRIDRDGLPVWTAKECRIRLTRHCFMRKPRRPSMLRVHHELYSGPLLL
jgi:hypothetical protein